MAAINATVEEEEVCNKCTITEALLATEDATLLVQISVIQQR